jgi:hypothetical protein
MNGLRNLAFDHLGADIELNFLGLSQENLYPQYSATQPPQENFFVVLRWGPTGVGIGSAAPVDLSIWAYEREPDYSRISDVLKRCKRVVPMLTSASTGDGWVLGVEDTGGSPDLYDDVWARYTRNHTFRITASGL